MNLSSYLKKLKADCSTAPLHLISPQMSSITHLKNKNNFKTLLLIWDNTAITFFKKNAQCFEVLKGLPGRQIFRVRQGEYPWRGGGGTRKLLMCLAWYLENTVWGELRLEKEARMNMLEAKASLIPTWTQPYACFQAFFVGMAYHFDGISLPSNATAMPCLWRPLFCMHCRLARDSKAGLKTGQSSKGVSACDLNVLLYPGNRWDKSLNDTAEQLGVGRWSSSF